MRGTFLALAMHAAPKRRDVPTHLSSLTLTTLSTMLHALTLGFGTGLASALHCAAMCGPVATAVCGRERAGAASLRYHAGRVLGYVAAGALAGSLGARIARHLPPVGLLPAVSALLLAGMAFKLWRRSTHAARASSGVTVTPLVPASGLTLRARRRAPRGVRWLREPLVLGTLSALLPCGALLGAWLLAAMTGTALHGASFMAGFVLMSGAAVSASAWLLRRVASTRGPVLARGGAALLLVLAALTVAPLLSASHARAVTGQPAATPRCH